MNHLFLVPTQAIITQALYLNRSYYIVINTLLCQSTYTLLQPDKILIHCQIFPIEVFRA